MKPVLTRAQMRAFDRCAIDDCHVPGLVLMENAGRGAADVITALYAPAGLRIVVVCGTGNNGGDGFVVARHMLGRGADVSVVLAGKSEGLRGDAATNHRAFTGLGGGVVELSPGFAAADLERALAGADLIVDALFGTGLDRPIEGFFEPFVVAINAAPATTIALDLPSGLDADTGAVLGAVVRADVTVTFGHMKAGLVTPAGAGAAGRVEIVGLGVPASLALRVGHAAEMLDAAAVRPWISARAASAHKHAAGSVLLVAGRPGTVGAALLVGRGALRAGAGLVTIASWPAAIDALESRVVEMMTARLDPAAIEASLDAALVGKKAVVVGPGLGTDAEAEKAVLHLLGADITKVLDADALTLFADRLDPIARARGAVILTPHPGEAARLLGVTAAEVERDRFGAARELSKRTNATAVLKGAYTIICSPRGTYVNTSGNPVLATAGAGDVLAGIVGAFACGLPPDEAACAAVFCHGRAADLWRSDRADADRGLLAGEIADEIPRVLAAVARGEDALTV
jgi:ADP-dependent NAD(P)H-hydrate dehydratase / NAD(P)H-hydrate epimerase